MTEFAGRYRLFEPLGRGAVGTVYRGHDPFQDLDVAVKVIERVPEADPSRERMHEALFYNETRAAGLLRHPGIVRVFDAGLDEGSFFIAMEYVPGARTLEHWCSRRTLMPVKQAAEVVFKCAEALDYAHKKGVVHRDIKPANVLISEAREVKLGDFGIALLIDPHLAATQMMPSAGSPLYMSPEQVREEGLTSQSDLFSLGVVLYELLTGVHPFIGESVATVTRSILDDVPRPVTALRPDVPASLERVVERALAKRCADRYPSAYELAAALGQVFSELERPLDGVAAEGRAELLRKLTFFDSFHDAEVWELLRWAEWRDYEDGSTILAEGEEGDSFFILAAGEVVVRKGEREVTRLGAGECLGEIGYLSNHRRTATVIARGKASVLRISARELDRASSSCQLQFQRVFIGTLIERLVQTTGALAASGGRRAGERRRA